MSIILLDIGNVMVSVDFLPFCRAVALDRDSDCGKIYEAYCAGELKDGLDRGSIAPFEYLAMIASDPHARALPLDELRERWQNIFEPLAGCREAVGLLKERHSIWTMSDTDPLHFAFLLNTVPELRTMDRYYLSYEHGRLKSTVDAFNHVLESSAREAGELILIDDKAENCACAEAVGIRTILFRNWPDTLAGLDEYGLSSL
jgi:FMN phosphatase YigB (HAD superfamily)